MKQFLGKEQVPIFGWTEGVPVEDQALEQLKQCANLPFVHPHIAVMPDVHWGMGATVGSVIPSVKAIVPAAVGVDIGCGMIACKTSIKASHLPDSLAQIRSDIERAVPHGTPSPKQRDTGSWHDLPDFISEACIGSRQGFENIIARHAGFEKWRDKFAHQCGTLGGGNHFIELCVEQETQDDPFVWIMLHSGSRGIGNKLGTYFIELAQREMERWYINTPNKDLAYLAEGSQYFDDYILAVEWAQDFARLNREMMLKSVQNVLLRYWPDATMDISAINCHHNYVSRENHYGRNVWLTRKGAVRAREGDLGIIPGSMGAKSFIVRGKGNPESFHSCSHGAGRTLSRTKAEKSISLEQHIKDTEGVECRKDASVLDESPAAYKNIDSVMAAQSDLVDIVAVLKQVLCVKG